MSVRERGIKSGPRYLEFWGVDAAFDVIDNCREIIQRMNEYLKLKNLVYQVRVNEHQASRSYASDSSGSILIGNDILMPEHPEAFIEGILSDFG